MGKGEDEEPVQRITNAPASLEADQRHRMWVYSLQMAVRLVCLFLAVLIPSPWRWLFVLGAVLLPYTAVLLANAGRDRRESVILLDPRQISGPTAGPTRGPGASGAPGSANSGPDDVETER